MADEIAEVFRREAGRCTATLIRILGDIDLAEDAVAEAFAIAAERWPAEGLPDNPGAWITTTARNRAIDRLRRESTRTDRSIAAHRLADTEGVVHHPELADLDAFVDVVADDQLRLIFLCCHPMLGADAQVALTLRLLGGLDTAEIARAFLLPESTLAQRIVRAKRKLREDRAPYRVPRDAELPDRLPAVLATVSLIYTEGHTATSGEGLTRVDLAREAVRLGRLLVELMPDEPEAVGLLALMLLTEARRPARTAADGSLVRLADQDRSRWDAALIAEGHDLVRACLRRDDPGPFQVQAAIAAVHADAATAEATDWGQVVALYDQLHALRPDAVVALNRAVALAERDGAAAGLAALAELGPDERARLDGYQPFHAARADLLLRAGDRPAAVAAYDRALALTTNPVERVFLEAQRAAASADRVAASLTVDAAPEEVFAVLADPSSHASIDGTGWVTGAEDPAPVTAAGQVFRMAMYHPDHPDEAYETANLVDVYDRPRAIAWRTGTESADTGELSFGGWSWRYDLAPADGDRTVVTLTYDWSAVGPEVRSYLTFPPFPDGHLDRSLAHLADLVRGR